MVTLRWLFDRTHGSRRFSSDNSTSLIAKRFEARLATIPHVERTDERLSQVFLEVVEAACRDVERAD
jgi:hypothetical protein